MLDKDTASPPKRKPRKGVGIKKTLLMCIAASAVLFYIAEMFYWFNKDVQEIAAIYAGAIMIERECKRRDDMVPALINIAGKYAQHEQALFAYVADAKSQLLPAAGMKNGPTAARSEELLSKLIALSEQYPQLKAVQSFQDLMDMIETTEDRIAQMRDTYDVAVQEFNNCNQSFWCPFFTYFTNIFCPMPAFVNYCYYKSRFTGEWRKLQAPVMLQEELTEKEKNELKKPPLFHLDYLDSLASDIQIDVPIPPSDLHGKENAGK